MLQKRNDFEVVESLRNGPKHLRQIATDLGLNPVTTMRILNTLEQEMILDYKYQGRNKVFSIKETIDAEIYLMMVEQYKFLKLIQNSSLRNIIGELQKNTNNELILLFGSYAKGTQTKDSDIDVYVETEDIVLRNNLRKISEKLSIKIGKFDIASPLTKEILKNHVIIQNAERFFKIIK